MIAKILLIGCGDLATRLAGQLPADRFHCTGLRRHVDQLPPSIEPLPWDLDRPEGPGQRIAGFDVVVVSLVPGSRDPGGYQRTFVDNVAKIVEGLKEGAAPRRVIFISSTSVYGQNDGEWVDEDSPTEPANFRGEALRRGEQCLRDSGLPTSVLRMSGIYGRDSGRLLRQVREQGIQESDWRYGNRIHAEDSAGVIAHLIEKEMRGEEVPRVILASDCDPAPLWDVKAWIADQLNLPGPTTPPPDKPPTSKRCNNRRLRDTGYRFQYSTYREGYGELLKEALKISSRAPRTFV